MLAWPYLIINGWLPYRDIAIAHTPLLIVLLSAFYKVFGLGIVQLQMFTWFLITTNSILTYYVSSKYFNKRTGYFSAILYILFCLIFEGNGLWFDLALVPFVLLLYIFIKESKHFYAGIIFSLGLLTKQTFIYFALPILVEWLKDRQDVYVKARKFLFGLLTVFSVFLILLALLGIADDFYLWTVKFGIIYLPNTAGQVSLPNLKQFVFALAPFAILVFDFSLLPFVLAGIFGVYPRWELFHFQPALPFLAIIFSKEIFTNKSKIFRVLISIFLICYLSVGLSRQVGKNIRFYEPEVKKVLARLAQDKVEKIYVINYWDNIYSLSNTLPQTKPLIPYIPWYLSYGNNELIILASLKTNMPKALVVNEREDLNWKDLYIFIDRYYICDTVEGRVELCTLNK